MHVTRSNWLINVFPLVFLGFLSEITSTYNEAFYFSGACIAMSTCVLSLVPVFAPMRRPGPIEDPGEVVEHLMIVEKETVV